MEDKDLFSYDNSNNIVNDGESSFDLNSFSTNKEEPKPPKKQKTKSFTNSFNLLSCRSYYREHCGCFIFGVCVYYGGRHG